jgi:hypothetical protein
MALRFIPGLERAKAAPVTEARVRKLIADAGGGGGGGPVAWGDVTGKPSVFPPDAHTQAASSITDLATTVQGYPLSAFADPVAAVDFAQQQSLQFVIENRTSDPGSPVSGQIWLRTDL